MPANSPNVYADRFQRRGRAGTYRVLVQSQLTSGDEIQVTGWLPEEVTFDVSAQYEAPYAQGLNQALPILGQVARALGVSLVTQAMTSQVWQGSTEINFQIPFVFQAETDAYNDVIKPIKDLLRLTMPRDPQGGGLLQSPGPRISIEKLKETVGATLELDELVPQIGGTNVTDTNGFLNGGLRDLLNRAETAFRKAEKKATAIWTDLTTNPLGTAVSLGTDFSLLAKKTTEAGAQTVNRQLVNAIENNISLYIGDFLYFPSVVITDVGQAYNILMAPDDNPSRATVNVTFRTFYIPTDRDLEAMFTTGLLRDGKLQDEG